MALVIGVIGKNEQHPNDVISDQTIAMARDVGAAIAKAGAVLATGGRQGVMEAASRGAKEAGGLTIGFLPSMNKADANPYVDIVFPTGLGRARNLLIARGCDALIMIGGSCGTLNELTIAYAEGKPVVLLSGSGGWADRIQPVLYDGKYIDERHIVEISIASDPATAAATALARAVRTDQPRGDRP